jgi:predicted flap endonuclease-1-like 5' DNA nuclease
MTTILGAALILLGLALGFIIAWALSVGASMNLAIGLLLLIVGVIIGFISEWLIDEAYRRNRELRRQLGERSGTPVLLGASPGPVNQGDETASETLADFLRQRDEELRDLRDKLGAMDGQVDKLQNEFEAYQQTHPDDLTVIKGVGPVYQWKLRDIGVGSYKQLATADPDQLRRMLDIKNWQRVDIQAWIDQARDWARRGNNA